MVIALGDYLGNRPNAGGRKDGAEGGPVID